MVGQQLFDYWENTWDFEKIFSAGVANNQLITMTYEQFKQMSINKIDELVQESVGGLQMRTGFGVDVYPEKDEMEST